MANVSAVQRGRMLLEKCSLFRALDEKARRDIATYARLRSFIAGDPICRLGDHGDSMMAVIIGTVRISLPTARGKEIILADLRSGELFGEIALLDGRPRSANAMALTNCELMVLERRDVIPFLERNPAASLKLMEMLCARIRRSDERMADIAFFNLPVRLAKTLLSYPSQGRGAIKLSLSQSELAEMSGGTREKVNRCLRDWHRQGILELKDRWTIIRKPEALREIVDFGLADPQRAEPDIPSQYWSACRRATACIDRHFYCDPRHRHRRLGRPHSALQQASIHPNPIASRWADGSQKWRHR